MEENSWNGRCRCGQMASFYYQYNACRTWCEYSSSFVEHDANYWWEILLIIFRGVTLNDVLRSFKINSKRTVVFTVFFSFLASLSNQNLGAYEAGRLESVQLATCFEMFPDGDQIICRTIKLKQLRCDPSKLSQPPRKYIYVHILYKYIYICIYYKHVKCV